METSMVFGTDREMAVRYTASVREVILKELKGAYWKMEIIEGYSYSKDSCFCSLEPESEPEPEQPEPEYGAKRRRDGGEAAGSSSKRGRKT